MKKQILFLSLVVIIGIIPIVNASHIEEGEECIFTNEESGFGATQTFVGIWGLSSNDVWSVVRVAGTNSRALHNTGSGWVDTQNIPRLANDLWFLSTNDGWITHTTTSNTQGPWHYTGSSFVETTTNSASSRAFRGIWASSSTDIWTVDDAGSTTVRDRIFQSTDGLTFTLQTIAPDTTRLSDVWGFASDDIWFSGGTATTGAVLLHYDGLNYNDESINLPRTNFNGFYIWGLSSDDLWLSGFGATNADNGLFHKIGSTWIEIELELAVYGQVFGISENQIWISGRTSTPVMMHGGPTNFQLVSTNTATTAWQAIWAADTENVWAVDNNGIIGRQSCHQCQLDIVNLTIPTLFVFIIFLGFVAFIARKMVGG